MRVSESGREGREREGGREGESERGLGVYFFIQVISDIKEKPWTLRKKVKLLKEAREYTARFEGKLSAGGGPSKFAEIKVFQLLLTILTTKSTCIVPAFYRWRGPRQAGPYLTTWHLWCRGRERSDRLRATLAESSPPISLSYAGYFGLTWFRRR